MIDKSSFSDATQAAPMQDIRRAAMSVLCEGRTDELTGLVDSLGALPGHDDIRKPESGLLMVRGRIGGDGPPFNVGEVTVTRCAVRLTTSEIGFGYVMGRDTAKARLVALCDALLQTADYREPVTRQVVEPVRARLQRELAATASQTAATRVDFFTLVRGEDAA